MESVPAALAPAPRADPRQAERPPYELAPRWANAALLVLGALMIVLLCKGVHDQNTKRLSTFLAGALALAGPYALAAWIVLRSRPARSTLFLALGLALAFRAAPLFTDTYLSTDLYRYVWDGRVQAHGINPYRYVPGDANLVPLRDGDIYPNINRRNYAKTVYPPGSQAVFLLATRLGETVTCIRLTMVAFEALAAWLIVLILAEYGLPAQRVLLYAWHPLVIWEFAGGGHCDAIMIACVALAFLTHRRGQEMATGAALGLAVLAKLFPLILFPALYRKFRWGWKMPLSLAAVVCAGYLPYTLTYSFAGALGFLPMYTQEEGLQSGDRFYFLNMLPLGVLHALHLPPNKVFPLLAAGAFAAAGAWATWRRDDDDGRSVFRRGACVAAMFVAVLSPAVDWYCTWLVFFLPFLPEVWIGWMTIATFALYENWFNDSASDIYILNSFIFLPAILFYAAPAAIRWRRAYHPPAMSKLLPLLTLVLILPLAAVRAQDASASPTPTGTVATGIAGFWRCELPGGVYLVALKNIQSVSSSEYVVDGAARVTEVTVATSSSVEARFYFLEPVGANAASPVGGSATAQLQTLQQRVQDLATTHAPVEPVWEKVVKNYPATTHAHTVEYRLTTKANLQQIEASLEQAWTTNKGLSLKTE